MSDGKHKNKGLNFGGFSGYYGNMSAHDGYGGFDYVSAFDYMNASMWTNPNGYGYQVGWCDTGYQNLAAAAKATSLGWIYQYGLMESASNHSFSLESLLATASFSSNQSWQIISYAEKHGSLVQKASVTVPLSYDHVDTIKFTGKLAKGFSNIAAVAFQMVSYGSPGNSCSYGTAVYGAQMAVDNLKVTFSKKADLKHQAGQMLTPYQLHHHSDHGTAHAAVSAQMPHQVAQPHAQGANQGAVHTHSNDHAELFSPGHESGLTDQFHLPAIDHLLG